MLVWGAGVKGQQEEPPGGEPGTGEPGTVEAGEARPLEAEPAQLIRETYALTKTAKTIEDYTEIIENCRNLAALALPAEHADYAQKLMSWAENRRGERYSDQAAALLDAGKTMEAAELDQQALADFEEAIRHDPARWKAIHNRGVSQALEGKYEEALADFNRALRLHTRYANTWFNRGEVLYELGRYAEAVQDYGRALGLAPRDAQARTSRGHALFQLAIGASGGQRRRYAEQALADYDQAVRLAPRSAEAYANRADAHRSLGHWEQAAVDYRQALLLDPKLGRAYQGAAWLMATSPEARFRDAEKAIQAAEQAIQLDGQATYQHLDTLAAAFANAQRFEEARSTQAKAIEQAPSDKREPLEKRLSLYEADKPFREGA